MAGKSHLSLVDGTGGQLPTSSNSAGTGVFRSTGILTDDGGTYYRGPDQTAATLSDGGGGAMRFTLPDLRWNVALLNATAVLFLGALVGMFLWMIDRIDDQFEGAETKITAVSDKVSDLRVEIAGQRADIRTILEKLDDNSQTVSEPGQSEPVRQGTAD